MEKKRQHVTNASTDFSLRCAQNYEKRALQKAEPGPRAEKAEHFVPFARARTLPPPLLQCSSCFPIVVVDNIYAAAAPTGRSSFLPPPPSIRQSPWAAPACLFLHFCYISQLLFCNLDPQATNSRGKRKKEQVENVTTPRGGN